MVSWRSAFMALKNQQRPLWRWFVTSAVLGTVTPNVSLYVRIFVVSRAAAITSADVTAFLATRFRAVGAKRGVALLRPRGVDAE
jgi:hypothetical protein